LATFSASSGSIAGSASRSGSDARSRAVVR
jgi:hypothetical protein